MFSLTPLVAIGANIPLGYDEKLACSASGTESNLVLRATRKRDLFSSLFPMRYMYVENSARLCA
jgi:hypothetical protein